MVLKFQNKTNIEIIGFYGIKIMHFGFAVYSSDIDLWHKDLLDTGLPLC